MKACATLVLWLLFFGVADAQLEKILHATYEVDSLETISLEIAGEYVIEKWAGNMILAETTVKLYDGSKNILKHFIDNGRYDLVLSMEGKNAKLSSSITRNNPIRTKNGECYELTFTKLLVPEDYRVENNNMLVVDSPKQEIPMTSKQNEN